MFFSAGNNLVKGSIYKGDRDFYLWNIVYALYFPLVVLLAYYITFPSWPDLMDRYLFEDLLIGWGINLLFLLPGLILPFLMLPCMLGLYIGLVVPTLVYAGSLVIFKQSFNYDFAQFLWDTNIQEMLEFGKAYMSFGVTIVLCVVLFVPLLIVFGAWRSPRPKTNLKRWCFSFIIISSAVTYHFYIMQLPFSSFLKQYCDVNIRPYFFRYYAREFYKFRSMVANEKKSFTSIAETARKNFPINDLKSKSNTRRPDAGIIIIGESASQLHQGFYGYFRDTTPILSTISQDLLVFNDAETAYGGTMRALLGAFSFVDREHPGVQNYKTSLIDILNEAHYETYWFSNPLAENIIDLAAATPFIKTLNSGVQYRHELASPDEKGRRLDIESVSILRDVLSSNNSATEKAIFLHLNGSHTAYSNRYPDSFDHFRDYPDDPHRPWLTESKKRMINQYDNSILYTDYVVSRVIEAAKAQGGASFVLYFSDHGEDVYNTADVLGRFGKDGQMTDAVRKVPFILWFSEEYKRENPEIVEAAKSHLNSKFVLDDLIWTLTDLFNLTFDGFDPEKSLVNPAYK